MHSRVRGIETDLKWRDSIVSLSIDPSSALLQLFCPCSSPPSHSATPVPPSFLSLLPLLHTPFSACCPCSMPLPQPATPAPRPFLSLLPLLHTPSQFAAPAPHPFLSLLPLLLSPILFCYPILLSALVPLVSSVPEPSAAPPELGQAAERGYRAGAAAITTWSHCTPGVHRAHCFFPGRYSTRTIHAVRLFKNSIEAALVRRGGDIKERGGCYSMIGAKRCLQGASG